MATLAENVPTGNFLCSATFEYNGSRKEVNNCPWKLTWSIQSQNAAFSASILYHLCSEFKTPLHVHINMLMYTPRRTMGMARSQCPCVCLGHSEGWKPQIVGVGGEPRALGHISSPVAQVLVCRGCCLGQTILALSRAPPFFFEAFLGNALEPQGGIIFIGTGSTCLFVPF